MPRKTRIGVGGAPLSFDMNSFASSSLSSLFLSSSSVGIRGDKEEWDEGESEGEEEEEEEYEEDEQEEENEEEDEDEEDESEEEE